MTGGWFHEECSSFMRRIRDEGVRCVTATLMFDEIWYVIIKNNVEQKVKFKSIYLSHY